MKAALFAVLGLATGLVVAGAPTANGLVLLLGVIVGAVLVLTVEFEREHRRRDDADLAMWRQVSADLHLEEADR